MTLPSFYALMWKWKTHFPWHVTLTLEIVPSYDKATRRVTFRYPWLGLGETTGTLLQNIIPQIVTQVIANVNNTNGGNGNGGNNGCSYKTFIVCNPKEFDGKGGTVSLTHWIEKIESVFDNSGCTANQRVRFHEPAKLVLHLVTPESLHIKRYINGLAPQIRGMLWVTQPTTIQSAILTAGILTDEAVCCETLTKGNDKRKEMKVSSKKGSTWKDNKKFKTRSGFAVTVPPRNNNVSTYPKCAKCYTFHPENAPCKWCLQIRLGWGRIRGHAMNVGVLTIFAMIAPSRNKQLDKQGTRWLWRETGTPETMGTKEEEGNGNEIESL
nr:reverse transcriptase domain-containing protein [Tanacetum cinerariifolium]